MSQLTKILLELLSCTLPQLPPSNILFDDDADSVDDEGFPDDGKYHYHNIDSSLFGPELY